MDLTDKICLVTGAARGIGLAIADRLHQAGAKVVLCDVDKEQVERAAASLSAHRAIGVQADVSKERDIEYAVETTLKKWGEVSVWINNAGLARHASVADIRGDDIDRMMSVNVKGTILGSKHALKRMAPFRSGHIVNILSTAALNGLPGQSVYCASKFAARGFTLALQEEAAPLGIRVTAVLPGGVNTPFWIDAKERDRPPESILLPPEQIAKAVLSVLQTDEMCVIKELVVRSIHDVDTLPPAKEGAAQ